MFQKDAAGKLHKCLDLRIGPLYYQLHAYSNRGLSLLDKISRHFQNQTCTGKPDRIIHLAQDSAETVYIPAGEYSSDWQRQESHLDTTWLAPETEHVFWDVDTEPTTGPLRFYLPWGLIIKDMVALGGGLVHAGLAVHNDTGLLFLAPPSGGKSTTLSTIPSHWQALSDDAALIWPGSHSGWYASPLPAWGNILNPESPWSYQDMDLARSCQLKALLILEKSNNITLEQVKPSEIITPLYRSFREYPAAMLGSRQEQEPIFRLSAQMARNLTVWRLSLPRRGDIWPLLAKEVV